MNAIAKCKEIGRTYCVGFTVAPTAETYMVFAEEMLLSKAFEALLETAVKFSLPHTTVQITFSALAAPGEALVEIESTGRTIPQESISRFFDVLAIAETIVPGGDLGLRPPVAERIMTLFGGAVTVENVAPQGIRISVRLIRIAPSNFLDQQRTVTQSLNPPPAVLRS